MLQLGASKKQIYCFARTLVSCFDDPCCRFLEVILHRTSSHSHRLLLPTPLVPVQPTPRILPYLLPPRLPRQFCRSSTPHTCLTVEYHLLLLPRPLKPKPILKLFRGYKERIRLGRDGNVYRARNRARCLQLGGLAGIN